MQLRNVLSPLRVEPNLSGAGVSVGLAAPTGLQRLEQSEQRQRQHSTALQPWAEETHDRQEKGMMEQWFSYSFSSGREMNKSEK